MVIVKGEILQLTPFPSQQSSKKPKSCIGFEISNVYCGNIYGNYLMWLAAIIPCKSKKQI